MYRTVRYAVCDGCYRDEYHDDIAIAQTIGATHLCTECEARDRYICRICGKVHDGSLQSDDDCQHGGE